VSNGDKSIKIIEVGEYNLINANLARKKTINSAYMIAIEMGKKEKIYLATRDNLVNFPVQFGRLI